MSATKSHPMHADDLSDKRSVPLCGETCRTVAGVQSRSRCVATWQP